MFKIHVGNHIIVLLKQLKVIKKELKRLNDSGGNGEEVIERIRGIPVLNFDFIIDTLPPDIPLPSYITGEDSSYSSSSSGEDSTSGSGTQREDSDINNSPIPSPSSRGGKRGERGNVFLEFSNPDKLTKMYNKCLNAAREDCESHGKQLLPPENLILRALEMCPPSETKVIILGQDPYYQPGKATGLCFDVPLVPLHPKHGRPLHYKRSSITTIFDQLGHEGYDLPEMEKRGSLVSWAEKGVLMLNTILTVREGKANSHSQKKIGWNEFVTSVILEIIMRPPLLRGDISEDSVYPLILVSWGNKALKFMHNALKTAGWCLHEEMGCTSPYKIYLCSMSPDDEDTTPVNAGKRIYLVTNCHPSPQNARLIKEGWTGGTMFQDIESLVGVEKGDLFNVC